MMKGKLYDPIQVANSLVTGLVNQKFKVRISLLVLLFLVQLLYFPINRIMTGGVVLETSLDALIILQPGWVVPYLLIILWWLICFVWAAIKMSENQLGGIIWAWCGCRFGYWRV